MNGRVGTVGVFNFSFCQRRATVKTPVDGFEAAKYKTFFHDFAQRTKLVGLVAEIHGQVGAVPVGQNTQPFEVQALTLDLFQSVGASLGLYFTNRQVLAVFFLDLDFDGHAVAVPAGHIVGIEAIHRAAFNDDVFQDFVDRVADVNVAVGIRRAIVQHKFWSPLAGCANGSINLVFFPFGNPFGFAPGQIATHREGGFGQVQSFSIVHGAQSNRELAAHHYRWRLSLWAGRGKFLRRAET